MLSPLPYPNDIGPDKQIILRTHNIYFGREIRKIYYNSNPLADPHQRTSDGGNGNHSVSLPIILIKIKINQMLSSSYISSLLDSIL